VRIRESGALVVCGLFFVVLVLAVAPHFGGLTAAGVSGSQAGAALWTGRTEEVLFQGLIILAGVFSILLLLGRSSGGTGR
jgi:hypothetical protein